MFNLRSALFLAFISLLSFFNACKEDHINHVNTPLDINYDAVYIVNGEDATISVIDLASNTVKATVTIGVHGGHLDNSSSIMWPHHIYLNPSKTKLALGVPSVDLSGGHGGHNTDTVKGKVVVLDAKSVSILSNVETPHMNHNSVFSPDGSEIWTAVMDSIGMVYVYDANTYSLKDSISVGMMPAEVTFSSDGMMAFVCNGMSNDVTVIDPANKTVMTTLPVGMNPVGAWPGSNNKMYVDNEMDMTISVIDVASMLVEESVSLGFTPGYAAYNSQMTELWVTDDGGGRVVYYHRMNNQWTQMGSIITGAGAHAITFTSDGMKAYITNQRAGTVSVIDVSTHTKTLDITVGTKPNGLLIRYAN